MILKEQEKKYQKQRRNQQKQKTSYVKKNKYNRGISYIFLNINYSFF